MEQQGTVTNTCYHHMERPNRARKKPPNPVAACTLEAADAGVGDGELPVPLAPEGDAGGGTLSGEPEPPLGPPPLDGPLPADGDVPVEVELVFVLEDLSLIEKLEQAMRVSLA